MKYELKSFTIGTISLNIETAKLIANFSLQSGPVGCDHQKMWAADSSFVELGDTTSGKEIFTAVENAAKQFVSQNYPDK